MLQPNTYHPRKETKMAISEIMDNDSKATLNGFLAIADKALETYSELKKHCNLKVQMRVYASNEPVSYMHMVEVRSIRDRVKALQEVENDAIDAFTRYASDLSQHRAYGNEREFKDALKHAKAECYKLEGDLGLYIDN
jgi:hypothetical protein